MLPVVCQSALLLFVQGAALSTYTGLRRGCLGALALGGPCPPRRALLPADDDTGVATRVCVVVGDADPYAPHKELEACFGSYSRHGRFDGVHVVKGMGHVVSEDSIVTGLAFLSSLLHEGAAATDLSTTIP